MERKCARVAYGSICMRVAIVSRQTTLTLATTLVLVLPFNARNEHCCISKLELLPQVQFVWSLLEGQDALDLLTEGVLCLQELCLFTFDEVKKSMRLYISCIVPP